MPAAGRPQLVMRRPRLADLPPVILSAGYRLRAFRPGDEAAWDAIIQETFETLPGQTTFENTMRPDSAFRPQRVLFVLWNDLPVGTASAWYREQYGESTGYLHMVGVIPAHQGRRLGYGVSLGALHRLRSEGRGAAVLQTDDFRLPAVKTYLDLDFEPLLVHENQRGRWRAVFEALGDGEAWCRRFAQILEGEVVEEGTRRQ